MTHYESDESPVEPAPNDKKRGRVRLFILGAIFVQLAIPPTYYLRDDVYDERFSWRMFSGVRMQRCRTAASETLATGERPITLRRVVHVGWIEQLRRNRRDVIEGFLERRCQEAGVQAVRVVNSCVDAENAALPPLEYERACDEVQP